MGTSKLQQQVAELLQRDFSRHIVRENIRPDWLVNDDGNRLELDFYIEDIGVALEIQGAQHFVFTPHFHKHPGGFLKRLRDDRRKRTICKRFDVELCEICSLQDYQDFISGLSFMRKGHKYKWIHPLSVRRRLIVCFRHVEQLETDYINNETKLEAVDQDNTEKILKYQRKLSKIRRLIAAHKAKIGFLLLRAPRRRKRKLVNRSIRATAATQGCLAPTPPPSPAPDRIGTPGRRWRARKKTVMPVGNGWIVRGDNVHIVEWVGGEYTCTCPNHGVDNKDCTHVVAVMMHKMRAEEHQRAIVPVWMALPEPSRVSVIPVLS